MILTVEQRAAGLKAIDEAKDAYVNDLHKERALIEAAELFRADGITAWEEVERLKWDIRGLKYRQEVHKDLANQIHKQLQDALNTLDWYADQANYEQEKKLYDENEPMDFYWEPPEVYEDGGARAKAAIQRIQEASND